MTSSNTVNPRAVVDIGLEREQMRREARKLLGEAMTDLTDKQLFVTLHRAQGATLEDIAALMHVTNQAVSLHELAAHKRMRTYLERRGIHSYADVA